MQSPLPPCEVAFYVRPSNMQREPRAQRDIPACEVRELSSSDNSESRVFVGIRLERYKYTPTFLNFGPP